jgi:hypothetical protein
MNFEEVQPQEFSTGRGNFLTVALDLTRGQSRVLSDAEAARAAAEATRRQARGNADVLMLSSGVA